MKQLSIFDVCERKHGGNARSIEARARTNVTGRRKQVYDFIVRCKEAGATSHEISQALNLPMHVISGRISELKLIGRVMAVGERNGADILRATYSGFRYETE